MTESHVQNLTGNAMHLHVVTIFIGYWLACGQFGDLTIPINVSSSEDQSEPEEEEEEREMSSGKGGSAQAKVSDSDSCSDSLFNEVRAEIEKADDCEHATMLAEAFDAPAGVLFN